MKVKDLLKKRTAKAMENVNIKRSVDVDGFMEVLGGNCKEIKVVECHVNFPSDSFLERFLANAISSEYGESDYEVNERIPADLFIEKFDNERDYLDSYDEDDFRDLKDMGYENAVMLVNKMLEQLNAWKDEYEVNYFITNVINVNGAPIQS